MGISSSLSWDRKSQRAALSCCRVAAGHRAVSAQGGLSYWRTSKTSPPHQVPMNTFLKYFFFFFRYKKEFKYCSYGFLPLLGIDQEPGRGGSCCPAVSLQLHHVCLLIGLSWKFTISFGETILKQKKASPLFWGKGGDQTLKELTCQNPIRNTSI